MELITGSKLNVMRVVAARGPFGKCNEGADGGVNAWESRRPLDSLVD
jgi:hypothetical protein